MPDPEVFVRCVREQVGKGKDNAQATAFCQARLEKGGIFKPGTKELTDRGSRREALSIASSKRESPAKREQVEAEVARKKAAEASRLERERRKQASQARQQ